MMKFYVISEKQLKLLLKISRTIGNLYVYGAWDDCEGSCSGFDEHNARVLEKDLENMIDRLKVLEVEDDNS